MDISKLAYFVSVADTRNFTAASKRLFISQPSLSRHINELEYELGVRLFIRSKHSVDLTPEGASLLPLAKEIIEKNPAALVKMPKQHEKNIVRLDVDEIAILLDEAESGEKLTERQKIYHNKTKKRDMAILTLLLGTGIRVSECVGLDLDDVDLKNNGIKIHRKGGAEVVVYFGEEVRNALCGYMEERKLITPVSGDENALFLSMQKRRIGVRAVENLVKKYAKLVTNLKNITPHKLRSTYGTSLYRETGDIYLVADVLGHKDVNTTKKHYAAIEEDRRRSAAKYVHLREDET